MTGSTFTGPLCISNVRGDSKLCIDVDASGGASFDGPVSTTNAITVRDSANNSIQGYIPGGQGVTQQNIYTVAGNARAVAKWLMINVNKLSGSQPIVTVKGYVYNRLINTFFEVFRITVDTSVENTVTIHDPIGFALNSTDVLYFVADTDRDNTIIRMRFSLLEYENN